MTRVAEDRAWIVVLSEAEGLRWVVKYSRMAFSAGSAARAARVRSGNRIILYVGRGAFHNPTRDEAQLGALGVVTSPVRPFRKPIEIAGRQFVCGCDPELQIVLERAGILVRPLMDELSFVRRKGAWGQYFRSGLVVPARDFEVMSKALRSGAEARR